MTLTHPLNGLHQIADRYDAFLIDQFGVLHDGARLFPGASQLLDELRVRGKRIAVLTNSGKRAGDNTKRLLAMGLRAAQFDAVVSSGEVAWQALASGAITVTGKAFIVGKSGDDYGFGDLGLAFTDDPAEAGVILILGSNAPKTTLEHYSALLSNPAARAVPAICCNPDLLMMTSHGLLPAPGAIAAQYAATGGPVTYVGKPEPLVYRHALHLIGNPDPQATLCIGDSIVHDVKGGRAAGLATLLVRTGISTGLSDGEIAAECRAHAIAPDWMMPALQW